jgi:hypothetical protein
MRSNRVAIAATLAVMATSASSVRADPSPTPDGISIEDRSTVDYRGRVHEVWVPRDAAGVPLLTDEFYQRINRPDLIDARARRRTTAIVAALGGLVLTGFAVYEFAQGFGGAAGQNCDINSTTFSSCVQAGVDAGQAFMTKNVPIGIGLMLGGVIAMGASGYLFTHPEPISELEAERLAAAHNRGAISAVTPYTDGNGGAGVLVSGRF